MLDALVLLIGKMVLWIMRRLGRHGAALPGLIAEKLRPSLLLKLNELPEGIIVISGTNGKTTTTRLVTDVLRRSGKRVFTNHSGSNMTRGLLASIIRFTTLTGRLNYDVAVLEIDEAYAAKLAPLLTPRASILTNVLRDQLDRFGEIDYTADLLFKLAEHTTELVVYNARDSRLSRIVEKKSKSKVISFGFDDSLASYFPDDDALYGKSKNTSRADCELLAVDKGTLHLMYVDKKISIDVSTLAGWHNALNLTATYALIKTLFTDIDDNVFDNLKPPYGRGETLWVKEKRLILQLVKNPAGFRIAMDVEPTLPALIVINDAIADSRDVSWLWDVDVDPLRHRESIYCSGSRAYDMTVRLKYNDINVVSTTTDVLESLESFLRDNREGVVFLTYTAMLETRHILSNKMGASRD